MTRMQMDFQKLQEDKRHNLANEANQRYSADRSLEGSKYSADSGLKGKQIAADASRYGSDVSKQIAADKLGLDKQKFEHEKERDRNEQVLRAIDTGTRVVGTLSSAIKPI